MNELDTNYQPCSKCKVVKPVCDFNFRVRASGVRQSYCRDCGKELTRSHYKRNKRLYLDRNTHAYEKRREIVRRAKAKPCADCGVQYPFYVMDFDHRDGVSKSFELNSVHWKTITVIQREIEKCDVVCANRHRERTHKRSTQPKLTSSKLDTVRER